MASRSMSSPGSPIRLRKSLVSIRSRQARLPTATMYLPLFAHWQSMEYCCTSLSSSWTPARCTFNNRRPCSTSPCASRMKGRSMANPALRPDAPRPTRSASTITMRSSGKQSARRRPADNPVNPAPITSQSVACSPSSLRPGDGGGRMLYHPLPPSYLGKNPTLWLPGVNE